jgi:hypothetical protein
MPMAKQFIANIRAHAHALVKIARKACDPIISQELEGMALELLKEAHNFEKELHG